MAASSTDVPVDELGVFCRCGHLDADHLYERYWCVWCLIGSGCSFFLEGELSVGWAEFYIVQLKAGRPVTFRPRGNSMAGKIESGQEVTVVPLGDRKLRIGDVVLCKVRGREYLHLVHQVDERGRAMIGNNIGGRNGWTGRDNVFGLVTRVE